MIPDEGGGERVFIIRWVGFPVQVLCAHCQTTVGVDGVLCLIEDLFTKI